MPIVQYFEIAGLVLFIPQVFEDSRGHFLESFSKKWMAENDIDADFVQDNESCSKKGVIRGLHFQSPPFAQGKLVRVVSGRILDVAVDIRKNSPTYGQHIAIELSAANRKLFYIPPGFAHGFAALDDQTLVQYKCTAYYSQQSEATLKWDDPAFNIAWPFDNPLISDKDQLGANFNSFISPFDFS